MPICTTSSRDVQQPSNLVVQITAEYICHSPWNFCFPISLSLVGLEDRFEDRFLPDAASVVVFPKMCVADCVYEWPTQKGPAPLAVSGSQ